MADHLAPVTVAHPWQRTARTVLQGLLALAVVLPTIALTVGLDPAVYPVVGTILAVAAGFARVMALPGVEAFLRAYIPWLAARDVAAEDVAAQVDPDPSGLGFVAGPASSTPDGQPVTVAPAQLAA